jgi:hypothetical protein
MTKNQCGGNRAKKQARKHVNNDAAAAADPSKLHVRVSLDPAEMYACVSKVYGNGMCQVFTLQGGVEYLCFIRSKFRGRFKRDNTVSPNTWVLVGARTWASTTAGKRPECDLLEVYSSLELEQLISRGILPPSAASSSASTTTAAHDTSRNDHKKKKNENENDDGGGRGGDDDDDNDDDDYFQFSSSATMPFAPVIERHEDGPLPLAPPRNSAPMINIDDI